MGVERAPCQRQAALVKQMESGSADGSGTGCWNPHQRTLGALATATRAARRAEGRVAVGSDRRDVASRIRHSLEELGDIGGGAHVANGKETADLEILLQAHRECFDHLMIVEEANLFHIIVGIHCGGHGLQIRLMRGPINDLGAALVVPARCGVHRALDSGTDTLSE